MTSLWCHKGCRWLWRFHWKAVDAGGSLHHSHSWLWVKAPRRPASCRATNHIAGPRRPSVCVPDLHFPLVLLLRLLYLNAITLFFFAPCHRYFLFSATLAFFSPTLSSPSYLTPTRSRLFFSLLFFITLSKHSDNSILTLSPPPPSSCLFALPKLLSLLPLHAEGKPMFPALGQRRRQIVLLSWPSVFVNTCLGYAWLSSCNTYIQEMNSLVP